MQLRIYEKDLTLIITISKRDIKKDIFFIVFRVYFSVI